MKKKKKGISRYTVMFIPDTSDNASSYELTFDKLARWIVLVLSFFAIIICLFISVILRNNEAMYGENGYEARIEALKAENEALKEELKEISENTEEPVSENIEEPAGSAGSGESKEDEKTGESEEKTGSSENPQDEDIPGIFPLNGSSAIIRDPTSQAGSNPNRLVMAARSGCEVIAAAGGTVEDISEYEPEESEFRFVIRVDHKNGYETVYLISGDPQISVLKGAEVARGDVLASLSDDETIVGYDIIYEGESLDPSGLGAWNSFDGT